MSQDQAGSGSTGTSPERTSRRVLEPIDRVLEVLFGLIMVLTFTGSLSAAIAASPSIETSVLAGLERMKQPGSWCGPGALATGGAGTARRRGRGRARSS